jgi:hypothetical protein
VCLCLLALSLPFRSVSRPPALSPARPPARPPSAQANWIKECLLRLDPTDANIAAHSREVLQQLKGNLEHSQPQSNDPAWTTYMVVVRIINSKVAF